MTAARGLDDYLSTASMLDSFVGLSQRLGAREAYAPFDSDIR